MIPKATIIEAVKPVVAGAPLKKPELIERVMAETGMKKKDVKPVVEAMLTVLGRALTKGEDLTVPPLGKLMVKRTKEAANATIVTVKLRHPNDTSGPKKTIVGDEVI
ncbi:MAG: HU family DNA-binding protein [Octadecabacter sp.]|nr:HU family DNA-binding protein [Octadecabacter sp.]